jgi:uncharacterized membrane protein YfcA
MTTEVVIAMSAGIFIIAFLYSSVGHAGASGYIAVMTLFGLAPAVIRPAALVLNILVACIASWQYWKAGYFSWKIFWPFAMTSIPFAFVGGYVALPTDILRLILGLALIYSAVRFFSRPNPDEEPTPPKRVTAVALGAGLGFLSGLTGVGGGIFLTPLLIFMRWARTKTASAVSALFILVNSTAGLLGNFAGTRELPGFALSLAVGAVAGGTLGSYFGSRRFDVRAIKILLGLVLLIAGVKLIFA